MSNSTQHAGANLVTLSTRVANLLAKNNISLEQAKMMSIEEWNILVKEPGNGIGVAAVMELQQFFSTVSEPGDESSSADKRGRAELKQKVTDVADLLELFAEKHTSTEVIDLVAKNSKSKTIKNKELAEYLWGRFALAPHDVRVSILTPIFRTIYRHQVDTTHKEILLNSLLSEQGNANADNMRMHITKEWGFRKAIGKLVSHTGPTKYSLIAQIMATVLLDVMDLLNMVKIFKGHTAQGHIINKVIIRSKEAMLSKEDHNLIKLLTKEVGTEMKPFSQEWNKSTRLPDGTQLYSGHNLKYNSGTQPSHVKEVLNTIQRTGYVIPKQFVNPAHSAGKAFRKLLRIHFKTDGRDNNVSYLKAMEFLDNYDGRVLYSTVSITADNGRLNFNGFPFGFHSGGLGWVFQLANQIMLTKEEASRLEDRIAALDGKLKLKTKEQMERLHYMVALEQYHSGTPSGVVTSNDFKGSGPLMQSILMKDVDGLRMSIEMDGNSPSDPYMAIFDQLVIINGLNSRQELVDFYLNGMRNLHPGSELDIATVRNWIKFHVQPMQYGSGSITSEKNGRSEGSLLDQKEFEKAFELGLPHTWNMLKILKSWVSVYNKSAKSLMVSEADFNRCDYTNAFGVNCTFTPLSKSTASEPKGFINRFLIMGHSMEVPCKIIDKDQWGVGAIAAASHQLDASVLFMIHMLFGEDMYSIHDDFRVSIREEERLQKIAVSVLKYFWEKENLLDDYISQVFQDSTAGTSYRAGIEKMEVPEVNWDNVGKVLFS